MPYGYYELFRVFAMCSFVFSWHTEKDEKDIWLLLWIVSAILVQPFYKFIIVKEIWNIIDVLWAFFINLVTEKKNMKELDLSYNQFVTRYKANEITVLVDIQNSTRSFRKTWSIKLETDY